MEISALLRWVQRNIRYTMDIRGVETIQTPPNTLRLKAGDCDDMSMLLASLLESVNHPTRFVAIGMRKGALCHVLVETRVGGKWIPLEATENWPAGAGPNGVRDRMIHHN